MALGEWFCTLPWNRGSLLLLMVAVLVLADGGQLAVWGGLAGACLVETLTSLPHDMLAPLAVRCTCDPSAGCDTQLPIPITSVPTTGQCLKSKDKSVLEKQTTARSIIIPFTVTVFVVTISPTTIINTIVVVTITCYHRHEYFHRVPYQAWCFHE